MPNYEFRFIKATTGRSNTRTRWAMDEDHLRLLLAGEGIVPDEIALLPAEPATERQISYMASLGILFPADITKDEASDLLTNHLEQRPVADLDDFTIASTMRAEVTRYASKKAIYRSILFAIQQRANDEEIGAWYAYRVYRNGHDRALAGIRDPLDERFAAIGRQVAADQKLRASLRRAAQNATSAFRYFGQIVTPDGVVLQGESDRSEVYQYVLDALFECGLLNGVRHPEYRFIGGGGRAAGKSAGMRDRPVKGAVVSQLSRRFHTAVGVCLAIAVGWYLYR